MYFVVQKYLLAVIDIESSANLSHFFLAKNMEHSSLAEDQYLHLNYTHVITKITEERKKLEQGKYLIPMKMYSNVLIYFLFPTTN